MFTHAINVIIILNKMKSNKPKIKFLEELESYTSDKDCIGENHQKRYDKFEK